MEAEINLLARNRPFLSLVSTIAETIVDAFGDTGTSVQPAACENVVSSVLKVLDVADRYDDVEFQPQLEPLKHKLKVAIAEMRHSRETPVLQRVLLNSIQLLGLLLNFEDEATKKLYATTVSRLEQLATVDCEDMQLLVEALQCVPPFIQHLRNRLSLVSEKAVFWKFGAAASRSKFYVQFLANAFKLATSHSGSQSVKALKCFAVQQLRTCLSKMCDTVCTEPGSDGANSVAGSFVEAMDQALYLLSEEPSDKSKGRLCTLLEALVSHGMSLHQLSAGGTKEKVYAACKEVVELKVLLEGTSEGGAAGDGLASYGRMAGALEGFEATVNVAVVELIVEHYMGLTVGLSRLLEAAELYAAQERPVEEESANLSVGFKASVMDFCSVVDLTYGIVHQAICCSTDEQRVCHLLSNVDALEQLDPELVAGAVATATDTSDEGVKASVSLLRHSWEVHARNLFRGLLHLTNPETFFGALNASLKRYVSKTEQADSETTMKEVVKEIVVHASSAVDMCEVVFEDLGLPAALQVATDHLSVALGALRNAEPDRITKRVKVVRGCAWKVWEELRNHLPASTIPAFSGFDTAKPSETTIREVVGTGSGNVVSTFDITELLKDVHFSTRSNISKAPSPREKTAEQTLHEWRDGSKIFVNSFGGEVSRLPRRHGTFVGGLSAALQTTGQQRLEHSIRLTEEAIGQSEVGQWIQNNSSICTLARRMKEVAVEACAVPRETKGHSGGNCDTFVELSRLARKFNEELTVLRSHVEDSTQQSRLELEKLQLQFSCCVNKLSIFAAAVIKDPVLRAVPPIDVVQRTMSLASEALKVLSASCKRTNAEKKCSLLGNHSCMSRLWMLKLSSCSGSATSV